MAENTRLASWARWWRTLRGLHAEQLAWRARFLLERRLPPPCALWSWPVRRRPRVRAELPDPALPGIGRPCGTAAPTELEEGVFTHLNRRQLLGRNPTHWRLGPVSRQRLWTITLHYHAWLFDLACVAARRESGAERAAELFRAYLEDWIEHCSLDRPGARDLAWNAFAIATRIGWWVRSYAVLGPKPWQAWGALTEQFLRSLWQQAGYLGDHLEWDLRGNHLLRDLVGLAWAGRFFDEPRARRWLETAGRLAREQAAEQVLPDGGHFERSPMYHVQAMEDLATLICLLEDQAVVARLRQTWRRMARFLTWVRHPDGQIPLLNDSTLTGAAPADRMLGLGQRLGIPGAVVADAPGLPAQRVVSGPLGGRHFPDTGLAVWHGEPWSVFFDLGRPGPTCQPGHAHADSLSLECSFRGRRLLVDPGTMGYDLDERRRRDRATATHNTVCVDGHDSSECWHIFRVGRQASPLDVQVVLEPGRMIARAAHDGYDHLPGRPRHQRRLCVLDHAALEIVDRIDGGGRHRIEGGYLLAPDWSATPSAGGWDLACAGCRLRVALTGPAALRLFMSPAAYHPEFGLERTTVRLSWTWEDRLPLEVRTVVHGN